MVVFTLATKLVNSPVIKSNDDILVLDNTIRLLLTMFNDLTLDPDNEGNFEIRNFFKALRINGKNGTFMGKENQ